MWLCDGFRDGFKVAYVTEIDSSLVRHVRAPTRRTLSPSSLNLGYYSFGPLEGLSVNNIADIGKGSNHAPCVSTESTGC